MNNLSKYNFNIKTLNLAIKYNNSIKYLSILRYISN